MQLGLDISADSSADSVWRVLQDAKLVAACVPGASPASDARDEQRIALAIRLEEVTAHGWIAALGVDHDERVAAFRLTAREAPGTGQAVIQLRVALSGDEARAELRLAADYTITGEAEADKLEAAATSLLERFGERVAAEAAALPPAESVRPTATVRPVLGELPALARRDVRPLAAGALVLVAAWALARARAPRRGLRVSLRWRP
jgi:carbon monoxide dehydrogenase subunit G